MDLCWDRLKLEGVLGVESLEGEICRERLGCGVCGRVGRVWGLEFEDLEDWQM